MRGRDCFGLALSFLALKFRELPLCCAYYMIKGRAEKIFLGSVGRIGLGLDMANGRVKLGGIILVSLGRFSSGIYK